MISPRRTRLVRVADLPSFQRAIADALVGLDPDAARRCAVLVPTRAAAGQLRRSLEHQALGPDGPAAIVLPDFLTRAGWYEQMHARLPGVPPLAAPLGREVLAGAAAREAIDAGHVPPFRVRPALVAELVALYDAVRRLGRSIDAFERLLVDELEASADADRGARRLLQQTRFAVEVFRAYERRLAASGLLDEHGLRARLLSPADLEVRPADSGSGYRRLVVTVPDQAADPAGLWPADYDLIARLPGIEEVVLVATEAVLAAGYYERLQGELPGLEASARPSDQASAPRLIAPADRPEAHHFTFRDREEELVGAARAIKARARGAGAGTPGPAGETAIVFARPLPYVYLARRTFEICGVPYQALDSLPLGAEPWAAALDLVCEVVLSGYTRGALVALLRSPHFDFRPGDRPLDPKAIAAFDAFLQEARYFGGRDALKELAALAGGVATVAETACAMAEELSPLEADDRAARHLDVLLGFLRRYAAQPSGIGPADRLRQGSGGQEAGPSDGREPTPRAGRTDERTLRARAAILGALDGLRDAYARHDEVPRPFDEVVSAIRRWIEGQTFTPRTGDAGVHLVEAAAAPYGRFDHVHLVGLIETDWPDRSRRNIFYPPRLLADLGWPKEGDRLRGARARFADLLRLAGRSVTLSAFLLEEDAFVTPSIFLEDVPDAGLSQERGHPGDARVSLEDALCLEPVVPSVLTGEAARWLALRHTRRPADAPAFHGYAGSRAPARYAVSALERYADCPFRYFAARVLRLGEERDDEATMSPEARGRFIHELLRDFFDAWQQTGETAVTPANIAAARVLFSEIAERHVARLPGADRSIERRRLFGSAVASSLADRVLGQEVERTDRVVRRLIEHPFDGEFVFRTDEGPRTVRVRGVADRIDLLEGGRLRVIDYKSGRPPNAARAFQLQVYGACAEQALVPADGPAWRVAEAAYISLGGDRAYVPLGTGDKLAGALADGQARFLAAVDGVERGEFPPRPAELFRCNFCPYPAVCRKDYVGDE